MARLRRFAASKSPAPASFTPEHLAAARSLFPQRIRERGKQYFDDMRVSLDGVGPAGAVFFVEGSGEEYTVLLRADGLDISASTCTCPYQDYCKHIWAALLEAVEQGLQLYSTDPRDAEIGIEVSSDRDGGSWISDILRRPVRPVREPEKTYRVLFLLGVGNPWGLKPELHIRPALRYIRRDGSAGARTDYRDTAALEPLSPREEMLLEACRDREGRRLDLHIGLGYLQDDGGIPVYVDDPQDFQPVSLMHVESITVDFRPEGIPDQIGFHPWLTLKSTAGRDFMVAPGECVLDARGAEKLLFHPKSGTLALIPIDDANENRFLDIFVNARRPWNPPDIRIMEDLLPRRRIMPAAISTDVRTVMVVPKMILYISDLDRGKGADADGEAGGGASGGILIEVRQDSLDADLKPVRHDGGWWELLTEDFQAFRDRANEVMISLDGVPDGPHSFQVDLTLPDFLLTRARDLMADDVELRIKPGNIRIRPSREFSINLSSGIDWLELNVDVDGTRTPISDTDLARRMLFNGTDFIILDEQQIGKLALLCGVPPDSLGRRRFSPEDIGTVQGLGDLTDSVEHPQLKRTREIIARLKMGFDVVEKPPSDLLKAELREYQKEGLEWLRFLAHFGLGGILADDMGLGKTVQTIALLADALEQKDTGPFLVVAPLSTIPNWAAEFRRFLPDMDVRLHIGIGRAPLDAASEGGVSGGGVLSGTVLTTYQTLQRDAAEFSGVKWRLLCLDESQNVKNSATKTRKVIQNLPRDRALALSGTPVENSVMELWSVMDIVNPGLLGSLNSFKKRYLNAVSEGDEGRTAELRRRTAPFILRRTKDVVAADLPPKEEIVRTVELSPAESRFYSRLKNGLREEVRNLINSEGDAISKANAILIALLRLRQAAISPALLGEKPEVSSKFDEVLYLLDSVLAEGHKVLIFSQFVKALNLLRPRLDEKGVGYAFLDGSLSSRKREEAIRSFKQERDVFLISLKAGGTGLNLTEADYVFILDPWWNPAVETQAVDRSHRIGQSRPVIAYKFISTGTIEERIMELQAKKRRIAEDILSFDSSVIGRMDPAEILNLFR